MTFKGFPGYLKINKEMARKVREHEKELTMVIVFSVKDSVKESEEWRVGRERGAIVNKRLIVQVLQASLKKGKYNFWSYSKNIKEIEN